MNLLIKNVQIIGSDQKLPDSLDVFVSGEKIAAIGLFPGKKADTIIDGRGCYLAPGFIDVDTESDHYLSILNNPGQDDFLKQGVTSIIGGLCGASLAPLLYGSLESIEEWVDVRSVNVDWHTMGEFLNLISQKKLGVNFGTLVGHTTLRQAIIGKTPRNLTKNELTVLGEVLKRAVSEGGLGLSTGLGYVQSRETPYSELKFLVKIVQDLGGVYATHLRDDAEGLTESLAETIKITEETGSKTLISHFVPVKGYESKYEQALRQLEGLPNKLDLNFSIYPSDSRILKLYTFLPPWAQKDDLKVMALGLKDEWLSKKIIQDLPKIDPKKFVVAQAPDNEFVVGYSLEELRKIYSFKTYEEALIKLMLTTNLKATIFYKNIDYDLIKKAIQNSKSLIASNAASFKDDLWHKALKPERAVSTFTNFLALIFKDKIMSIEDGIKKITYEPARKFGMRERGVIRSGYFADLVGFREDKIEFVVVNGRIAVLNGERIDNSAGKVLKHRA